MLLNDRDRLALAAGLTNLLVLGLFVGLWYVWANAHAGSGGFGHTFTMSPVPDPIAVRVRHLMTAHQCWYSTQPAPVKVPGHVVASNRAGHVVYGGPRLVKAALGQVFKGTHLGLTVWGFCR